MTGAQSQPLPHARLGFHGSLSQPSNEHARSLQEAARLQNETARADMRAWICAAAATAVMCATVEAAGADDGTPSTTLAESC